jgi:hypothetical protein
MNMNIKTRLICAVAAAVVLVVVRPTPAFAQSLSGSLTEYVEKANGDHEVFLECANDYRTSPRKQYDLPDEWFERLKNFVQEHADWEGRVRAIMDGLEDRWDQREDRRDVLENFRDRLEDFRDHAEDLRDKWEDRHDEEFDLEDLFVRFEGRRDQRENRWDWRENLRDRCEGFRDRFEDMRDNRWLRQA